MTSDHTLSGVQHETDDLQLAKYMISVSRFWRRGTAALTLDAARAKARARAPVVFISVEHA